MTQRKADLARAAAAEEAAAKLRQDAIEAYEREAKAKAKEAEELRQAQLKKRQAEAELAAQKIEVSDDAGSSSNARLLPFTSVHHTHTPTHPHTAHTHTPHAHTHTHTPHAHTLTHTHTPTCTHVHPRCQVDGPHAWGGLSGVVFDLGRLNGRRRVSYRSSRTRWRLV